MTSIIFYILSAILVGASLGVITSRNPVYSVLFLILCFFNAAGLFIILGAEFLAMLIVIVYVGAVAVLFLFVVMMLNINLSKLREGFLKYAPLGLIFAGIICAELIMIVNADTAEVSAINAVVANGKTNTHAIGAVLYTDYIYPFQLSGLILFVAMVGAIVLTLRTRTGVRKQDSEKQMARKSDETISVISVESGKGIS